MTQTESPKPVLDPKPADDAPQKPGSSTGGASTPQKPDAIPDEDLDEVEEQPS